MGDAAVSEIIGPAGSDRQMFPPTVAAFHTLTEPSNAAQQWPISDAAGHGGSGARASSASVQVAAISRPSGCTRSEGQ